ncbi:MAG: peptidylprolyl isomerase [Candidatus Margulisbacteria bacterium]|nr:peptidylprolyl isomerase [Candidatus Margulisiibacteriota bacterium]
MLQFFRKNAAKICWAIVIFFAATMFSGTLFFGFMGDSSQGKRKLSGNEIALIGDVPVNPRKYINTLNDSYRILQQNASLAKLSPIFLETIQYTAFQQALRFTLLLENANQNKFKVTKKELKQTIDKLIITEDLKDKKALKALLKKQNYPYKSFVNSIKEDILAQKFQEALISNVRVSNKDVENKYTQVKVSHILIKTDDKTNEDAEKAILNIQAKINLGTPFSNAAKTFSEHPETQKQGGSLGWVRYGQTEPSFETAAFSLNPGELSNPVKTPLGYHLLYVHETKNLTRPDDFNMAKEKSALLKQKQSQVLQQFFQHQLATHPLNIFDKSLLAFHAKIQGDTDTAIGAYQSMSSANPQSPAPHFMLARIYTIENRDKEAKNEFLKMDIKNDMNKQYAIPMGNIGFGNLYRKEKNLKEMWKQYDKAMSYAGDDIRIYQSLLPIFKEFNNTKRIRQAKKEISRIQVLTTTLNQKPTTKKNG